MKSTKIEWCDATVNPVVGCTKGCVYCYARRLNQRFQWIEDFSIPQFFPGRLRQLSTKKPKRIFMNSMSDIADWKSEWMNETLSEIHKNSQNRYLFLTKRPGGYLPWTQFKAEYIWCGITVTSDKELDSRDLDMIRIIEETGDSLNWFYSIEPMLGPVNISLAAQRGLKWVILGAETGNRKGKVSPSLLWIRDVVDAADEAGIPVFMKNSLKGIMPDNEFRTEFPKGLQLE